MTDDQKFWIRFWTIIGITLTTIIMIINISMANEDKLKTELVKQGHDPIEVSCMFDDSMGDSPSCIVLATKK